MQELVCQTLVGVPQSVASICLRSSVYEFIDFRFVCGSTAVSQIDTKMPVK